MKTLKSFSLRLLFATLILVFSGLGMSDINTASARPPHGSPAWAPPYYTGVRYYYLPDIEAYYDLKREIFVYYRNGQWLFSATLPGIYASFDLYNGFVVALNVRSGEPWRFHNRYVTRYPRYYYEKEFYQKNIRDIRGYNEYSRHPYFSKEGAKHGTWKEMYKNDRSWKREKESDKVRKQEWKEQRKQDRNDQRKWHGSDKDNRGNNKHDKSEGRGNNHGRD